MSNPLFEFFELIAEELTAEGSRVLTSADLQARDEDSPLLSDLRSELRAASAEDAIAKAVAALDQHFQAKGGQLPFTYDAETGRFMARDRPYLEFINEMSSIRSVAKRSRDFECSVAERLGKRATGSIYRVGHPRDVKKRSRDFNAYLRTLGFAKPVLLGKEKDGGLDILWMLPIGTIPHRPFVSVQCKNGIFDIQSADASLGAGSRSLGQHAGLQAAIHVPCVLFNDYIEPERLTKKQMNFVPLGLTDLAALREPVIAIENL
jgi:hypothetical protein